jgi:hypothetical protein
VLARIARVGCQPRHHPAGADLFRPWEDAGLAAKNSQSFRREHSPRLTRFRPSLVENMMRAFIKRFLMHYGIYRRYPLRRFSALRNAGASLSPVYEDDDPRHVRAVPAAAMDCYQPGDGAGRGRGG